MLAGGAGADVSTAAAVVDSTGAGDAEAASGTAAGVTAAAAVEGQINQLSS